MAKKRYKPSLESLCHLGTIAHNRPFTQRDMHEYTGGNVPSRMRWLKRLNLVKKVPGGWYPTAKGWKMIERACSVSGTSLRSRR